MHIKLGLKLCSGIAIRTSRTAHESADQFPERIPSDIVIFSNFLRQANVLASVATDGP